MIIFTDIDDTLMKTARKVADVSSMKAGSLNHKGENNSYIDSKRLNLIQNLLLKQICIPVSARSKKSFANLLISFNHHAVLNFGATILDSKREVDLEWLNHIQSMSTQLNQDYVFKLIEKNFNLEIFEVKIVLEDEISCYMNYRSYDKKSMNTLKLKIEKLLIKLSLTDKFYFYQTDRDLALIPTFIKKEHGVNYLKKNHYLENDLTIGIGDHKNDLSFMKHCDFIMVPTDSTLMNLINKI